MSALNEMREPFVPGDGLGGPPSFMSIPVAAHARGCQAFVVGIPFDCGTHPTRIGARQGPAHIRRHSSLIRPFNPELGDFDAREALGLVDCGDMLVISSQIEQSFARIESVLFRLVSESRATAFTMGGDGSVSLPQMRALARLHPGMVAVHFDAHTDVVNPPAPDVHNSGTQFAYAAIEKLIDPGRSWHIGMRGTLPTPGFFEHAYGHGYNLVTLQELLERGFEDVISAIVTSVGSSPVYLCWDMDVIDPAFAPGVAAPSWGGLSAREAIQIIRLLRDLNIVHVDFNTVSPSHDPNGAAGSLAAQLMYETMTMLALRERDRARVP